MKWCNQNVFTTYCLGQRYGKDTNVTSGVVLGLEEVGSLATHKDIYETKDLLGGLV